MSSDVLDAGGKEVMVLGTKDKQIQESWPEEELWTWQLIGYVNAKTSGEMLNYRQAMEQRQHTNSEVATDLEEKSKVYLKVSNFKEPGNT